MNRFFSADFNQVTLMPYSLFSDRKLNISCRIS